jgi:predicted phosphate transport protein (TIGR00153 family)
MSAPLDSIREAGMLNWFQALMPREDRFFGLFNRHAATIVLGAEALRAMLEGGEGIADSCRRIMAHESEADGYTREVFLAVRRTFITPFDRGDIKELISLLDDAIDQMQKTAKTIILFEVQSFEPRMQEMGDIIVQASKLTVEAVGLLSAMQKNAGRLNELAEAITRVEEHADGVCDQGMKALFLKHRDANPMGFIVGAEIYDHLEKVVDRFEDVANRISGILIEHI